MEERWNIATAGFIISAILGGPRGGFDTASLVCQKVGG
jgi:hypothetical protein